MLNNMRVLITQKTFESLYRKADSLEINYLKYFEKKGFELILIPNFTKNLDFYLSLIIDGIIFSGGGDIGDELSKERIDIEKSLLDFAVKNKIPVLGICRGMQIINLYFGGSIQKIENISEQNHVATNHKLKIFGKDLINLIGEEIITNSYHNWGLIKDNLASGLKFFAKATDETIEGISHPSLPIAGIMWHPERDDQNGKSDLIIEAFLNKKLFWKK